MQTLVTGGAGFIGRHLVATLLERGLPVRVLDTQPRGAVPEAVEWLQGSILDEALLARALDGVEWVFHLAAIPHLWIADKPQYEQVNHQGARRVLQAAGRAGVRRFVHCSTEAVLSRTARDGVVDGSLDPSAGNQPGPYSRAKCLAELAALQAARDGLPVVVASPTAPLGPGDTSLTPPTRMLLDYLNGRYPAYLDCLLNLVDVRDVAEGLLCSAARGQLGRRYLLGGQNLHLRDLLARLKTMTGRAMPQNRVPYWMAWVGTAVGEAWADRVTHRPPAASLNGLRLVRRPLFYDSSLAAADLDWRARPLAATLADAIADLQGRGLLTSPPASRSSGSR